MPSKYREILAEQQTLLWGDKYARTMAQSLFSAGLHNTPATFQSYIRENPFGGGYLMTGGQNIIAEWLQKKWELTQDCIEYLREETGFNPMTGQHERLYTDEFIEMVRTTPLQLTIEAMPEGSIAFPDEPIYRVTGPVWQALWVETPITNSLNSQALLATLASRIVSVAQGEPVSDNGLRRAHSIGGLSESRAAYLGGFAGTSNDQAAMYYKLPSYGTMAHAYVMFFDTEEEAFRTYMRTMPQNCTFLIDTYDTIKGIKNAIKVASEMGKTIDSVRIQTPLKSIRHDSGDLAYLSDQARQMFDAAGMVDTKIIASNNLDEFKIDQIKRSPNGISIWAVGTRAATTDMNPDNGTVAPSQASLGAVYKLANVAKGLDVAAFNQLVADVRSGAIPLVPGVITDKIKISENQVKSTNPGAQAVVRYLTEDGMLNGSTLVPWLQQSPIDEATGRLRHDIVSVRKNDPSLRKVFPAGTRAYDPLRPMFAFGKLVSQPETIHDARIRGFEELARLDASHKRLINPHRFVVGIEEGLYQRRQSMITQLRA